MEIMKYLKSSVMKHIKVEIKAYILIYDILRIYKSKGYIVTAIISSWGNSQGLRFPKDIMKDLR